MRLIPLLFLLVGIVATVIGCYLEFGTGVAAIVLGVECLVISVIEARNQE